LKEECGKTGDSEIGFAGYKDEHDVTMMRHKNRVSEAIFKDKCNIIIQQE